MNDKNLFWGFMIVFLIVLMGAFAFSSGSSSSGTTGNIVNNQAVNSGDIQIVKMKVSGSSYVLEPSTVKKGIPVRIEADMSQMPGCSKSVVISAFNVRKSLSSSNNKIEFTPDKAGTFNIACSMNMYRGKFTVLESDGTKGTYAEPAPTGGATCGGAGGGGCGGCGG